MGLDQYAYCGLKAGQRGEFYETGEYVDGEFVNKNVVNPRDIAYWRKHPNLQGWMEKLWISKGYPGLSPGDKKYSHTFNGIELELTLDDINKLEEDIKNGAVAELNTTGFFFGNPSDDYYREKDLQFCRDAKFELFLKNRVFYNSSW